MSIVFCWFFLIDEMTGELFCARLRAALKPVLDIEMDMYTRSLSLEMAITEAKRIYNGESEVKE